MGYSKKDLKMFIRSLKRAIKMLNKMDKWTWNPIGSSTRIITELKEQLEYYQEQLKALRKVL